MNTLRQEKPTASFTSVPVRLLQRKLTDAGSSGAAGRREECRNRNQILQRFSDFAVRTDSQGESVSIPNEVLQSSGKPLSTSTRTMFESRFGHDFSRVRIHDDAKAAESASEVNARAYTVGNHVVFGEGQYAPSTSVGGRLLAHELTHVLQQNGAQGGGPMPDRLELGTAGDRFELEADATASRVMAGAHLSRPVTPSGLAVQRETSGDEAEKKPPEKKEVGEVLVEGLTTVAGQAKDNNPQVMKYFIDPVKDQFKNYWNRFGTNDKAATIGFGVATVGMAGGVMLSNPAGRKQLEGINLAAPLSLIPYMPLNSIKFASPSDGSPDNRLYKFETGFNADDLINLRTESRGLPRMSLSVNMQWGYDPATERLTILGGDASLGLVPGLSLSGGIYKDILRPAQPLVGPDGQTTEVRNRVPALDTPKPVPDVRIMLNVDLLKLADSARQLKKVF